MDKNSRMTLEQISENRELFLNNYGVKSEFEESGCDWDELMKIAQQFDKDRQSVYPDIIQKYISEIGMFESIHSYRYRIKETDSLIKKIIIKTKQKGRPITKENYLHEITDLLGIRVLYIFKEDYYPVHLQIWEKYASQMVKDIEIKLFKKDLKGNKS